MREEGIRAWRFRRLRLPHLESLFYSEVMTTRENEHDVTLSMADDVPARMIYAGRR